MDKLLLSVIVMSGLCAVSSNTVRRFHVVHELKNWTEAQRHCRENYKDLATIRDLEDMEMLKNLKRKIHSRAWVGLHSRWSWSLSNTSFFKPWETEFRRWNNKEPNNGFGKLCTHMYRGGAWNDVSCGDTCMTICFDVRGSNETVVFINISLTWTEAQSYCREHYTDLAIVRNLEENRRVENLIPPGVKVWIGLFRDGWKWSDGSDSSLRNWKMNEPRVSANTGVAADFSADGLWETLDSNIKSVSICNIDVVPVSMRVVKVRLEKSSSSLDLNDPVVMENLLKQLKQRVEDQGQNDLIKLSWKKQPDGKVFYKEEKENKKRRDEL